MFAFSSFIDKSIEINYIIIDDLRKNWNFYIKYVLNKSKVIIVIAGVTTPGKYLGYEPIKLNEIEFIGEICDKQIKILCGPVAKFGYCSEGGEIAISSDYFKKFYDIVIKGDPDLVIYELTRNNFSIEKIDPNYVHENYNLINKFAITGAKIVQQHPCFGKNLIVEIETYRSCMRKICGGCSFCVTVRQNFIGFREPEDIVKEIEILYNLGVKHFRIGRQADFYTYKAYDFGKIEFPKPNPNEIERLLKGIKNVAPNLETLHIDNVNPGTVYHWPKESIEITKILMKYHTPGNVAAMGIETADPKVVKINNLKVMPDEAFEAIKLISSIGYVRGWNGMPHILPGINFVLGLPGETKETYELNRQFLERLLQENILVRRVNIRLAMVFPETPLWYKRDEVRTNIQRHRKYIESFRYWVRNVFDYEMLKRVFPKGTILRKLYTELHDKNGTYARQVGSYSLIVYIPEKIDLNKWIDVVIVDHLSRSVIGIPYPLNINTASSKLIRKLPGIDNRLYKEILLKRPFKNFEEVKKLLGNEISKYITI